MNWVRCANAKVRASLPTPAYIDGESVCARFRKYNRRVADVMAGGAHVVRMSLQHAGDSRAAAWMRKEVQRWTLMCANRARTAPEPTSEVGAGCAMGKRPAWATACGRPKPPTSRACEQKRWRIDCKNPPPAEHAPNIAQILLLGNTSRSGWYGMAWGQFMSRHLCIHKLGSNFSRIVRAASQSITTKRRKRSHGAPKR